MPVLVLDTHVWLWSVHGDERRVGRRSRRILSQAEAIDGIRVSPATLFEVAALHTLGRVTLSCPLEQWIRDAMAAPGLRVAELTPTVAVDAGCIPRTALADPLDRLLVATARALDAVFMTADERILDYATRSRSVRVQDAGA